jgi:cell division protein ZipA
MLEPGYLEPEALQTDYVHGLVLFAVLPARRPGGEVLADMLATARRIAARLRGEVADADRSSLTPQTIQHLREKVIEFERRRSGAGA